MGEVGIFGLLSVCYSMRATEVGCIACAPQRWLYSMRATEVVARSTVFAPATRSTSAARASLLPRGEYRLNTCSVDTVGRDSVLLENPPVAGTLDLQRGCLPRKGEFNPEQQQGHSLLPLVRVLRRNRVMNQNPCQKPVLLTENRTKSLNRNIR